MTYPSDPFGPRDPKEPIQRMGKRGLGTALYLDVSLSRCKFARNGQFVNLPAIEKAELTFRSSLALLLLSFLGPRTTVRDQSAKRSALGGDGPRY